MAARTASFYTVSSGQGTNSGPVRGWTNVSRKSEATSLQKAQNG